MTYSVSAAQFAVKIGNIRTSTVSMRDDIQDALVAATYRCIAHSGGTTPFQQILDAVGGAAHRQGISTWMENFAPVRFVKDRVLLHKDNWAKMDKVAALADFDAFMQSAGANDDGKKWYQIAKKKNVTESVFNPDSRIISLLRALDSHECGTLAGYIREAVDKYNTATDLANKVVAAMAADRVDASLKAVVTSMAADDDVASMAVDEVVASMGL